MALKNFLYSLRTWKVKQTPQSEYEEWMCFLWYSYKSLRQKILRKRKNMQSVPINMSSNWVHFKYMNQTWTRSSENYLRWPQYSQLHTDRELYTFSFEKARYSNTVEFVESWICFHGLLLKSKVPLVVHIASCLKWYWTHINYVVNWWTVSLWFLSFKIHKT